MFEYPRGMGGQRFDMISTIPGFGWPRFCGSARPPIATRSRVPQAPAEAVSRRATLRSDPHTPNRSRTVECGDERRPFVGSGRVLKRAWHEQEHRPTNAGTASRSHHSRARPQPFRPGPPTAPTAARPAAICPKNRSSGSHSARARHPTESHRTATLAPKRHCLPPPCCRPPWDG